ncbi:hypothetical protein HanRHA438_Chr10g0456321 [Helianthus annuus]|nr:hypothetical protein HanRHA438_Chr10g0456321 [Helianthus annuus]
MVRYIYIYIFYITAFCYCCIFPTLQKFQVPELNSKWKRRLFVILHDKLKIPDFREIPGTFNAERVDRDIRADIPSSEEKFK